MSNLENHRKRAKQILRWHRERHWPVASQIREHVDGFDGLTDRQVLDSSFKLAQAQTVVARQAGFDSWSALKQSCESSSNAVRNDVSVATLDQAIPFLWVSDIARTCRFFAESLGFDVDFTYGEPAFYGEVERDGVRFALRHVDAPEIEAGRAYRHTEEIPAATVLIDRAKSLFKEYEHNGARSFRRFAPKLGARVLSSSRIRTPT